MRKDGLIKPSALHGLCLSCAYQLSSALPSISATKRPRIRDTCPSTRRFSHVAYDNRSGRRVALDGPRTPRPPSGRPQPLLIEKRFNVGQRRQLHELNRQLGGNQESIRADPPTTKQSQLIRKTPISDGRQNSENHDTSSKRHVWSSGEPAKDYNKHKEHSSSAAVQESPPSSSTKSGLTGSIRARMLDGSSKEARAATDPSKRQHIRSSRDSRLRSRGHTSPEDLRITNGRPHDTASNRTAKPSFLDVLATRFDKPTPTDIEGPRQEQGIDVPSAAKRSGWADLHLPTPTSAEDLFADAGQNAPSATKPKASGPLRRKILGSKDLAQLVADKNSAKSHNWGHLRLPDRTPIRRVIDQQSPPLTDRYSSKDHARPLDKDRPAATAKGSQPQQPGEVKPFRARFEQPQGPVVTEHGTPPSDFERLLREVALKPSSPPPRQRPFTMGRIGSRQPSDDGDAPTSEGRSFDELAARTLQSRRFGGAPPQELDVRSTRKRSRRNGRDLEQDDEDNEHRTRRRSRSDLDDVDELDGEAMQRRAAQIAQRDRERKQRVAEAAAKRAAEGKPISLPAFVTVSNLAQLLGVHYEQFVRRLARLGFDDVFASKVLDSETASLVAQEFGFNPSQDAALAESSERDLTPLPEPDQADTEYWPIRPPVVTIMGHVDHGKTTILDFLRKANVAAGEAGGITQHIGAFSVVLPATERSITFLDTPGHAAFLAMRQRGANVTDIVVLVVAADDSVKPQTLEALKHARAAQVPIIVAINKVDKPEADVERVKQDLSRYDVEIEDYGGDVQVIGVSGKTGQGMDALEEAIITQSEILDYRADTEGSVDGWILEATTKKAGRVATVLVRRGTVRPGCILVAGKTWTRVRVLRDDTGAEISEAPPGTPVEVDGWRDQPAAGDRALQAEDEQQAASVVEYRQELAERKQLAEDTDAINQARLDAQTKQTAETDATPEKPDDQQDGQQLVPFLVRADVSGSAEAVTAYIEGVGTPQIAPKILHSLVGSITESDIELAAAAKGSIVAFNVNTDERIRGLAASQGVQILENNIIYRIVEDVKEALEERLPRIITHKVLGEAEIAQAFSISIGGRKSVKIAGCKVRNGVIGRNSRARVMRGEAKVYDGTLSSLKNVKKDATEMRKGSECGIGFADWDEFETGDLVQTYEELSERRKL